jgi:hypothetical protein
MLLNKVHQSGKLDLEYDYNNWRVSKYTIALHKRLIVRTTVVRCESEKKGWRAQLNGNSKAFCSDISPIFVAIS